jgi:hypothetical protein
MEPNDATTLRLELSDDMLLTIEHVLPEPADGLDEQAEALREQYDEQILAALVAPSF